jgi:WD40 repeat protein/serine/threonine protein kinase
MNESLRGGKKETVTPVQWRQVKVLFDLALGLEPAAQQEFLASHMIDGQPVDEQAREEAARMLRDSVQVAHFLEEPLSLHSSAIRNFDRSLMAVGRRIGPYRIVQLIGRGGMSVVYLAERADDFFDRQVAVKLVWPEVMTREIQGRFTQERRILAKLDHLNIARLLDGGVDDDGCPYVVMEYIEGEPITAYCDARKLTLAERLKIFQQVCAAVQYAHNNLIVHRDLKPGNILVSSDGTVKLLDFGIAKLLDPLSLGITDTFPSQAGVRAMTPEYASPEQARGGPVTISSDLYSLGVIFYELISGHRPYQIKNRLAHEAAIAISQATLIPPSQAVERVIETPGIEGEKVVTHSLEKVSEARSKKTDRLRSALKGNLDAIALKALQKTPALRYQSASEFSEDIGRHLGGAPVIARKETWGDFSRRSWGRYKTRLLFLGVILILALVQVAAFLRDVQQTREREKSQLQLLRTLYAADMRQAGQDWTDKNNSQARELLKRYQGSDGDRVRGFEWYFLFNALNIVDERFQLRENTSELIVSPDAKHIYVGTASGKIEILDTAANQASATFAEMQDRVRAMTQSLDGKYLAAANAKGVLRVWDRSSADVVFETTVPNGVRIFCLALSPDGKWAAAGGDDATVRVWSLPSGQSGQSGRPPVLLKYSGKWVRAIQFSPDGKELAVCGTGDNAIDLWETPTFRRAAKLEGSPADFLHLSYSPDGKSLAAGTRDRVIRLWDRASGRLRKTLSGHQGLVWSISFSPDGSRLASAGEDRMIRYWDIETETEIANAQSEYEIDTLGFSPDPATPAVFYTAGDSVYRNILRVNESPYTITDFSSGDITSVTTAPDGSAIAAVNTVGSILLWDFREMKTRIILDNPQLSLHSVEYSPDSKRILVSGESLRGEGSIVQIRDASNGQLIKSLEGSKGYVYAAAFSPDNESLAAGGEDRKITFWDAASGKIQRMFEGHLDAVRSLHFFPGGGRLLSKGLDDQVIVWDVMTGVQLFRYLSIGAVALSTDGEKLAVCKDKYVVSVLDVNTRQAVVSLQGHGGPLRAIAFSPDGKRLATTSEDRSIRLWDVESGLAVLTLGRFNNQISSLTFSKDGRTLVSGGKDRKIRFWRSPF